MSYLQHNINLSNNQMRLLAKAVKNGSPINLKLTYKNLQSGKVPVIITKTQGNKIKKALQDKKGMVIKFSAAQVNKMRKDGGVLPVLAALAPFAIAALTGAAGAAGTFGANKALQAIDKALKKNKGSALFPPGHQGNVTGRGRRVSNMKFKVPVGNGLRPAGNGLRPAGNGLRPAGGALFPAGVRRSRLN